MGIFDNCLLASDIDGTLIDDGFLNPKNIEKIEYFMSEGGYFSLATGRSVNAISMVLNKLERVSPCVVDNGCLIYDYENSCSVYEAYISKKDYEIVKAVCELDLNVGVEVHVKDRVFTIKGTQELYSHQIYEKLETTEISFEAASKYGWNKILYTIESAEDRERLKEFLSNFESDSDYMDTIAFLDGKTRYYLEQLPKGVSKASTISKLAEILGIENGKIFAIGDYYNDLEMIKTADIGAAVQGSPDELRQSADYVTRRSCEQGAVADFIDFLVDKLGAK